MFDALLEAAKMYGLPGMGIAGVILVGVFFAKRAGLVVNGNIARLANVALGAILAGLSDNPEANTALLAALSSVLAGLAYELLKWLGGQIPAYRRYKAAR